MLKNNGFKEKIKKYKKIYVYPRNDHFRTKENISPLNPKPNLKIKYNLTQLLLENTNNQKVSLKNKSFMNYINSKTSLNPYFNELKQNSTEKKYIYMQRNKSSSNIFNKKNFFENKHQKVINELNIMKNDNNYINNNKTIKNTNFQMINIQKSKSINTTAISSKKNLYERIINPNLKANRENQNLNQNELNKKIDILNNTLLNEQKIIKSKNKVKYDIEKEKIKEIINIERAKKLKGLSVGRINFKKTYKKSAIIKSKLDKIKIIADKRSKSTPKNNIILQTCERNIRNKRKNRIYTEENYIGNNTEIYSLNNNNNNYINYSCDYSRGHHMTKKIKNILDLNNDKKYINLILNSPSIFTNGDEKIKKWIFKEKRSKEISKGLNNDLFSEDKTNKDFQNYKLSNKYFNNNNLLFNDRRTFKSINLGKYFDLELSRFNNKLNNFSNIKKAKHIINSKHVFKPIY